jgi:8-oxo-dGTP diphosphatase
LIFTGSAGAKAVSRYPLVFVPGRPDLPVTLTGMGDGDGWVDCDAGHRHWGRHGAAGLLLYHRDPEPHVLLQKRALLSIGGGTWGILGGARHSHEDAITGALREAAEESTLDPSVVRVHGLIGEHHGGWSYETVIASVAERPDVRRASFETAAVAWVHVDDVPRKKLFPAFADGWSRLRRALVRPVLVVHAAALDGADGGRSAADLARLRDRLAALGPVDDLPGTVTDRSYPEIILAADHGLDGSAVATDGAQHFVPTANTERVKPLGGTANTEAAARPGGVRNVGVSEGTVRMVTITDGGEGLARLVASSAPGEHRVIVTDDPLLRRRAEAAGATVADPRWLLGLLP